MVHPSYGCLTSATAARQAARRLGGPVLWTVPSGNRSVSVRPAPRVMIQPSRWTLVWWCTHSGRRLLTSR